MSSRTAAALVMILAFGVSRPRAAHSDAAPGSFLVTSIGGEFTGEVTRSDGSRPGAVDIEVVARGKARTVRTDRAGRFTVMIDGLGETWLLVGSGLRITGRNITTERVDDDEVIAIRDTPTLTKDPVPLTNPTIVPPYTKQAIDRNAWVRAFVLLEIDSRGVVQRVKLVSDPPHGLADVALAQAFALRFEPAVRGSKPAPALMLWKFEWPAFWWLLDNHGQAGQRMPPTILEVPCAGSGPVRRFMRDCSEPVLHRVGTAPWVTRPAPPPPPPRAGSTAA